MMKVLDNFLTFVFYGFVIRSHIFIVYHEIPLLPCLNKFATMTASCGGSSAVERFLAKEEVVGANPIRRSESDRNVHKCTENDN